MPNQSIEARWRARVEEFSRSGESVAEYCARRGLAKPTFYEWRRRLTASALPKVPFLPVRVAQPPPVVPSGGVEVMLRGGRRLRLERGFDPAVLTAALATLEGAAC